MCTQLKGRSAKLKEGSAGSLSSGAALSRSLEFCTSFLASLDLHFAVIQMATLTVPSSQFIKIQRVTVCKAL